MNETISSYFMQGFKRIMFLMQIQFERLENLKLKATVLRI